MVKWIWRFLRGYLIVELKGNSLERILNKLNKSGIILWDIRRIKHGFRFKMLAKEYKRLRLLIRYRKCTTKIIKKIGWPFFIYRSGRRKVLFVGIFIILLILKTLSLFLWGIALDGNQEISSEKIYNLFHEQGIKRGMLLKDIDLKKLEHVIMIENPTISWVSVSLEGTKLYVQVVEKQLIAETDLTDVIAKKAGVVTEMIVLQGKPTVEEGETVKKGQVLIAAANKHETFAQPDFEGNLPPYLPPADEAPTPARGIVKARVWYEGYGEAQCVLTRETLTGNQERALKVKIGSKTFHFAGSRSIPFVDYQIEKNVKRISLWRNLTLPIEIIKEDYLERAVYSERRTRETAIFLAKERALKSILNSLARDAIISQSQYFIISDGLEESNLIRVKVVLEVIEDISQAIIRGR